MNFDSENRECSLTIHKSVYFSLQTRMFTQKKNTLSRCCFVPPSYIVAGTRAGTIYRWTLPEKFEEEVLYPPYQISMHQGVVTTLHWAESTRQLISGAADRKLLCWQMDQRNPPKEPIQEICLFEESPLYVTTYMNFLFVMESRGITVLINQEIKGKVASRTEYRKVKFFDRPGYTFTSMCKPKC